MINTIGYKSKLHLNVISIVNVFFLVYTQINFYCACCSISGLISDSFWLPIFDEVLIQIWHKIRLTSAVFAGQAYYLKLICSMNKKKIHPEVRHDKSFEVGLASRSLLFRIWKQLLLKIWLVLQNLKWWPKKIGGNQIDKIDWVIYK